MATNGTLTTNQLRAIRALLASGTVIEAAQVAGLGERTIHRYMKDTAFRAALTQAEGDLLDAATRRLIFELAASVDTLAAIRDDQAAAPGARLRAAQVVIEQMARLRELRGVEERLAALEAAILGWEK